MVTERKLFHKAHYNILASQIRTELEKYAAPQSMGAIRRHTNIGARNALVELALSMAKRFKKDNPYFRHLQWLDACSPDPELYPISELWED